MPAYRKVIETIQDYNEFLQDKIYSNVNKVILFTNKKETSGLYKGITAEFNQRLQFAEVKGEIDELKSQFQVTTYPTMFIIIVKSADG